MVVSRNRTRKPKRKLLTDILDGIIMLWHDEVSGKIRNYVSKSWGCEVFRTLKVMLEIVYGVCSLWNF